MHFSLLNRNWTLCSTSVFGGDSSNISPWCNGNGNLNFHHWWNFDRTSDRPQVMLDTKLRGLLHFLKNMPPQVQISLCGLTGSSWAERNSGISCSLPHVSQLSCSSSSCPGSLRAHVTSSSTKEMMPDAKKVKHYCFFLLCWHRWNLIISKKKIDLISLKQKFQ